MHDADGREISTGDILVFYADATGAEPIFSADSAGFDYSLMIDVVIRTNDLYYAVNADVGGGVYLHRLVGCCRIDGTLFGDWKALKRTLTYRDPLAYQMAKQVLAARNTG